MKRLILALALCSAISAGAQNASGWYVGADAGLQLFNGYEDRFMDMNDRIEAPTFQITAGRYLVPGFSLDADISMSNMIGVYKHRDMHANFSTEQIYTPSDSQTGDKLHLQDGWYMHAYARAGVDLLTVLSKNPGKERKSQLTPFIGAGYAWGVSSNKGTASSPTIVYGLRYAHSVCKSLSGYLEANCYSLEDKLEGEMCEIHSLHSVYSLRLGLTFNFGK